MSKIPVEIHLMTLSTGHGAHDSLVYSIREEVFHHIDLEHHRNEQAKAKAVKAKMLIKPAN